MVDTSEAAEPYDQIASAIGEVCLWWTALEDVILGLSLHLSVFRDASFERDTAWDTLNTVLLGMDFRAKITTAKALAHHVDVEESADFYERLEELLNHIDNTLRTERNRYVHDTWHIDGQSAIRSKIGAVVRKTQSHQRELFLQSDRVFADIAEVRSFVSTLELAYDDLATLDNHISWLISHKEQPSRFRQPLPQQWRSLPHREKPESKKTKRQPR
ncbi:hypothetical protein [Mesorhizobium sp. M1403]|uniref:hypothetical protein n=1 Tax=Mesorhizobium sp. M1403 TaxID=2957097 RepID=UPI003339E33D